MSRLHDVPSNSWNSCQLRNGKERSSSVYALLEVLVIVKTTFV